MQTGTSHNSAVLQSGDFSFAYVDQGGSGNNSLVIQDGVGSGSNPNIASVTQRNAGQNSLVFQQGRGNVATVIQN